MGRGMAGCVCKARECPTTKQNDGFYLPLGIGWDEGGKWQVWSIIVPHLQLWRTS